MPFTAKPCPPSPPSSTTWTSSRAFLPYLETSTPTSLSSLGLTLPFLGVLSVPSRRLERFKTTRGSRWVLRSRPHSRPLFLLADFLLFLFPSTARRRQDDRNSYYHVALQRTSLPHLWSDGKSLRRLTRSVSRSFASLDLIFSSLFLFAMTSDHNLRTRRLQQHPLGDRSSVQPPPTTSRSLSSDYHPRKKCWGPSGSLRSSGRLSLRPLRNSSRFGLRYERSSTYHQASVRGNSLVNSATLLDRSGVVSRRLRILRRLRRRRLLRRRGIRSRRCYAP